MTATVAPPSYLGDYAAKCKCSEESVARYRTRISGPLLDRIDLHVDVPAERTLSTTSVPRIGLSFRF